MWPDWNNNPTVITIFSAPNYCGTFQNKAVIVSVKVCCLSIIEREIGNQAVQSIESEDPSAPEFQCF